MRRGLIAVSGVLLLLTEFAAAHEFDPGYLSLRESSAGVFQAQWKVSIEGGLYQALVPRLPPECSLDSQLRTYVVLDAQIQNTELTCEGGLANLTIAIGGLPSTMTDVLLRRHGKSIVEKQFALQRVADVAIDLFVGLSVLSRASSMPADDNEQH